MELEKNSDFFYNETNKVGMIIGCIGTVFNVLAIISLLPNAIKARTRSPNVLYTLIQSVLDCIVCVNWVICEYQIKKVTSTEGSCALYSGKALLWGFFSYRIGINLLAASHYYRRLVFPKIRIPLNTKPVMLLSHAVLVLHAFLAGYLHGIESIYSEKLKRCALCPDWFIVHSKYVGLLKVSVMIHISMLYAFPVMSTLFFYTAMTAALRESSNPFHQKAYNSIKKIYYMDCTIYLFLWFPYMLAYFMHHFTSAVAFDPMSLQHKVLFNLAFAYPALYPVIALYLRRDWSRMLMGGLDWKAIDGSSRGTEAEAKLIRDLDDQSMFSTNLRGYR